MEGPTDLYRLGNDTLLVTKMKSWDLLDPTLVQWPRVHEHPRVLRVCRQFLVDEGIEWAFNSQHVRLT